MCKAATVSGAVICTVCGYNFHTGQKVTTAIGVRDIPWKSSAGPVAAVAILVLIYVYGKPLVIKSTPGDGDGNGEQQTRTARRVWFLLLRFNLFRFILIRLVNRLSSP